MPADPADEEKEVLMVWEGGMVLNLRGMNGEPVKVKMNWLEFEEVMRFILLAVDQIPDEDLKDRLKRTWGKKLNGPDTRSEIDRLEDQRNTRRF